MPKGSHQREADNSIQRQILKDNVKAALYRQNEQKFLGDLAAMEKWAKEGFVSSPMTAHDILEQEVR